MKNRKMKFKYFIPLVMFMFWPVLFASESDDNKPNINPTCNKVISFDSYRKKNQKHYSKGIFGEGLDIVNYRKTFSVSLINLALQPRSYGQPVEFTDQYKQPIELARYIITAAIDYTISSNLYADTVPKYIKLHQKYYELVLAKWITDSIEKLASLSKLSESQVYNTALVLLYAKRSDVPFNSINSEMTKDMALKSISLVAGDIYSHLNSVIIKYEGTNKNDLNKYEPEY